jgi:hypothetical protein
MGVRLSRRNTCLSCAVKESTLAASLRPAGLRADTPVRRSLPPSDYEYQRKKVADFSL